MSHQTRSHRAFLFAPLLLIATCASALLAQSSRGTVTGLVQDASKAAISNAAVELTNEQTKVIRSTNSNDAGTYRFDAVDPGLYSVKVTAPGFKVISIRNFEVAAGQVVAKDTLLELGQVSSVVEVSGDSAQIQTEAPVRGGTISTQNIVELPIATQNPAMLALTLPGVSTNRYSFGADTFSVNGGRGRSNNFLIDGTENNDISVAGQAFEIKNPDSVQEVSVQTGNYDAEYGRAGGGVVNVITRSGTDQFHGTARYLLESTIFDAPTNLQKLSPDVLKRGHPLAGTDQFFSGTIGGPIRKDKTFFFSSFQEERQNSSSQTSLTTFSPAGRAALAALFPKGTNPRVDTLLQVTAGADANAQFFTASAGPGRPDIQFGSYQRPVPTPFRDRQLLERVDHTFSTRDQLSGRYMLDDGAQPVGGSTGFLGFDTSYKPRFQNVLASETHTFSPAATNELRLAYNRIFLFFPEDAVNPLAATLPQITIAGVFTGGSVLGIASNLPQGRVANNYQLQDTVNYIHGRHSWRFGTDLTDQRAKQAAPFNGRGTLNYNASGSVTGLANYIDDFGGSGGGASRDFGSPSYFPSLFRQAYFAQDRWRASDSLTLTLGVRYEYFGVPINSLQTPAFTGLFNVDPKTFTGPYSQPNSVQPDKNNFGPTVGIAYSPGDSGPLGKLLGNKKSVLRAGYQIGYDSFFNNIASNAKASSPNIVSTNNPSVVDTTNTRGLANLSSNFPAVARALSPLDSQTLVIKNLVNPYYQRWSAGIQRELPFHLILDASYVGSKGTRLFINEDLNPLVTPSLRNYPAGLGPADFLPSQIQGRFDPLQGSRLIRTNGGSSTYHSGQFSLSRRFSSGLVFNLAYTRSKFLDNSSDVFATAGNGLPQQSAIPSIFGGLKNDKGLSLYDRPNRMSFSYVYQLPIMHEQKGLVGHVVGGWQIAGVTTIESGAPISIANGQDADGLGGNFDRPNFNPAGRTGVRAVPNAASPTGYVNPDDPAGPNTPIDPHNAEYIGIPACTSTTTPCAPGNLGRFTARTPRLNNFDGTLTKSIHVTERLHMEFRMEAFNIFNHRQYGIRAISPFDASSTITIAANVFTSPAGRFLNPGFADGSARVIRYGLKFIF